MKGILFLVSGMLICLLILVAIFFVITHSTPSVHTSASKKTSGSAYPLTQQTPTINASINICTKQYPNYPLLSGILTTPKDRNLGVYSGKITNVNSEQHAITVTSQTNNQSFTFQSSSVNNVLYDIHGSKTNNFTILQTGMKAVISFPCTQKPGSFILNQFLLVQ